MEPYRRGIQVNSDEQDWILACGRFAFSWTAWWLDRARCSAMAALEKLNLALAFFRLGAAAESAEVAPLAGFGIGFSRVQSIRAGVQFTNHNVTPLIQNTLVCSIRLRVRFMQPLWLFDRIHRPSNRGRSDPSPWQNDATRKFYSVASVLFHLRPGRESNDRRRLRWQRQATARSL